MLGCIIEYFCHCPASSCLGHQQTHPRVREDSSGSFHTLTQAAWRRRAGAAASHIKAASIAQNLALVAQNKGEPKDIRFTIPFTFLP